MQNLLLLTTKLNRIWLRLFRLKDGRFPLDGLILRCWCTWRLFFLPAFQGYGVFLSFFAKTFAFTFFSSFPGCFVKCLLFALPIIQVERFIEAFRYAFFSLVPLTKDGFWIFEIVLRFPCRPVSSLSPRSSWSRFVVYLSIGYPSQATR